MPYTPTTWVNATTALSAVNLNNIENGVVAAVRADGSVDHTATQDFDQTLSGADKTYITITASDGKQYAIKQRNSDKALVIRNVTDSKDVAVILADGTGNVLTANQTPAPAFIGPIGSRPAAGSKWRLAFVTPFA